MGSCTTQQPAFAQRHPNTQAHCHHYHQHAPDRARPRMCGDAGGCAACFLEAAQQGTEQSTTVTAHRPPTRVFIHRQALKHPGRITPAQKALLEHTGASAVLPRTSTRIQTRGTQGRARWLPAHKPPEHATGCSSIYALRPAKRRQDHKWVGRTPGVACKHTHGTVTC